LKDAPTNEDYKNNNRRICSEQKKIVAVCDHERKTARRNMIIPFINFEHKRKMLAKY
jgi:hypothetical protein